MSQLTMIIIASWLAGLAAFGGGVIASATDGANTDAMGFAVGMMGKQLVD